MAWSSRSGGSAADPAEALPLGRSTCWAPPASDGRSADDPEAAAPVAHALAGRVSPAAAPDAQDSPPRRSPVPAAPRDPNPPPAGGASEAGPLPAANAPRSRPASGAPLSAAAPPDPEPSRVGWRPGTAVGRSCPGTACIRTGRGSAACREHVGTRARTAVGRSCGGAAPEVGAGARTPSAGRASSLRPDSGRDPTPLSPADDDPPRPASEPLRAANTSWSASGREPRPLSAGAPPRSASAREPGPPPVADEGPPRPASEPLAAVNAATSRPASGREPGPLSAADAQRRARVGATAYAPRARRAQRRDATPALSAADAAAPRSASGRDPGRCQWPTSQRRARVRTRPRPLSAADVAAPRSASGREPRPLSAADVAAPRSASVREPRGAVGAGLRTRRRAGAAFGAGRARGSAVVAVRSACPSRALFGRALLRQARRGGRACSSRGPRIAGLIRLPDVDGLRLSGGALLRCVLGRAAHGRGTRQTRRTCHRGADPAGLRTALFLRTRRTAWRIGTRRGFADACLADVDHHGRLGVGTVVGAAVGAGPGLTRPRSASFARARFRHSG